MNDGLNRSFGIRNLSSVIVIRAAFPLHATTLPVLPTPNFLPRNSCATAPPAYNHRPHQKGRYRSGQTGRTVNPLAYAFDGSNPSLPTPPPAEGAVWDCSGAMRRAIYTGCDLLPTSDAGFSPACWLARRCTHPRRSRQRRRPFLRLRPRPHRLRRSGKSSRLSA